jgi:hypothetical protein
MIKITIDIDFCVWVGVRESQVNGLFYPEDK